MTTFVDVLEAQAAVLGGQVAVRHLRNGEDDEATLSFAGLHLAAASLAVELAARVRPGERALLLCRPGPEFTVGLFGAMYAGVIAVPAYLPTAANRATTVARLHAVARDAGISCIIGSPGVRALQAELPEDLADSASLPWFDATPDRTASADRWERPAVDAGTVALIQYTSGSTSAPKGVVLTHGNLLANSTAIAGYVAHQERTVLCTWLPPYHDMGLIGCVLHPIHGGFPVVSMSPNDFLRRPRRWLAAISRFEATVVAAPTFGYDLCVRKVAPEAREGLDLSSLDVAIVGAEPVRAEVLDRFADAFGPSGFGRRAFKPSYGLAEATLLVTAPRHPRAPVVRRVDRAGLDVGVVVDGGSGDGCRDLMGCGEAVAGHEVRVVDPERCASLPDGTIGEIWVRGPSVATRYWGRARASAETFGARLEGGEETYLRTGDLGALQDAQLFVTGRSKDLLVVHGRNVYPEDVERAAERAAPGQLRAGGSAAFSTSDGSTAERAVLVASMERQVAGGELDETLAEVVAAVLAETGVALAAVVVIRHRSLPRTTSGKVQRAACRRAWEEGELPAVAAWAAPTVALATGPAGG